MSRLHTIRATDTQAQSSSRATTQRAGRDGHASILPSCGPPMRVAASIRLGEAAGGPVEQSRRATGAAPADTAADASDRVLEAGHHPAPRRERMHGTDHQVV